MAETIPLVFYDHAESSAAQTVQATRGEALDFVFSREAGGSFNVSGHSVYVRFARAGAAASLSVLSSIGSASQFTAAISDTETQSLPADFWTWQAFDETSKRLLAHGEMELGENLALSPVAAAPTLDQYVTPDALDVALENVVSYDADRKITGPDDNWNIDANGDAAFNDVAIAGLTVVDSLTLSTFTVSASGNATIGGTNTGDTAGWDTDTTFAANSDAKVATQKATKAYVATQIAALVASSPAALDTLNELAAALGNDASFATTVTNALAGKVPTSRTITINGTSQDLSADRSFTVSVAVGGITGLGTGVATALAANLGSQGSFMTLISARITGTFTKSGAGSATASTITDGTNSLSLSLEAGTAYRIFALVRYTCVSTEGISFSFANLSPTAWRGVWSDSGDSTVYQTTGMSSAATLCTAGNTLGTATLDAIIVTNAAGTLSLRAASAVDGSTSTVPVPAVLMATKI